MANGDFIKDCAIWSSWDAAALGNIREDLLDVITNISPTETPFLSGLAKVAARSTQHDWLTDSLARSGDPERGNRDVRCTGESVDAEFEDLSGRCRLNNLTHIIRRTYDVSETARAVAMAGVADEYTYQKMRALQRLAMDYEFAILYSERALQVAPQEEGECASPTGCRRMDGIFAAAGWDTRTFPCLTEELQGTILDPAGSPCTFLNPQILGDLAEAMWAKGASPKSIYVNSFQKRRISQFYFQGQTRNLGASEKMVVDSINAIDTDFGLLRVTVHRDMHPARVLLLDEQYLSLAVLRPIKGYELAKVGNSDKGMVEGEMTLEFRAPATLGYTDNLCTERGQSGGEGECDFGNHPECHQ